MHKYLVCCLYQNNHYDEIMCDAKDKIEAVHKYIKVKKCKDLVECNNKFLANKNSICVEIIVKEI